MTVSGVATQGSSDSPSWVTRFRIKYSDDGVTWEPFEEIGREAVRANAEEPRSTLRVALSDVLSVTNNSLPGFSD